MSDPTPIAAAEWLALTDKLEGELFYDNTPPHLARRRVYATDASVYQQLPLAVALPRQPADLRALIRFARKHRQTLIPRTAGTSLAGQVVGSGIVVDLSVHFNKVLEINTEERWVRVQPGVIRDDLNKQLAPLGLMYGPETSTSSRAMIGGMVGNNSCGLHSMVWGTARDHLLEARVLLANASEARWKADAPAPVAKSYQERINRELYDLLILPENQHLIRSRFPKKEVHRRNTGYALDALLGMSPFTAGGPPLNLCALLAGSEGTLALATELKLNLMPLPPEKVAVVCVHCYTLQQALEANLLALRHRPLASELVDRYILDFTKGHPLYEPNRFFIEGDPAALLMVEFMAADEATLHQQVEDFRQALAAQNLCFASPVVKGENTRLVWEVRKAGLGLIRNLPGDAQPVNLIEDCAVSPQDLPAYVADVQALLKKHGLTASYYAHAGAGELHIEPILNLKTDEGRVLFRQLLAETVELVRKYGGSLSGEHGDGRLRGEFIPVLMGTEVAGLFGQVKQIFDPEGVFNAGKIVGTPPMDAFLRTDVHRDRSLKTYFDFSGQENIVRLTEKCSGSGDCRKTQLTGGTMCPSYMATRRENDTTRARANILRQFLSEDRRANPFNHPEIAEVMDLCLSCKACKTECPSGVDITKLKAEYLQHRYDARGVPFRTRLVGHFSHLSAIGSLLPGVYNLMATSDPFAGFLKQVIGFAPQRTLPLLAAETLRSWFRKNEYELNRNASQGPVYFFADEFTNYNDVAAGQAALEALSKLGYRVRLPAHDESGRTLLSKGLLKAARRVAEANVRLLTEALPEGVPLVGLEPSALLTFRDEYPELVGPRYREAARRLADRSLLFDEFIAREIDNKAIRPEHFTRDTRHIRLHGHCYQKALASLTPSKKMLSLPENYSVRLIASGCCGMAGSFGYEAEHYEVSMKIGELVLFPEIRKEAPEVLIAAAGTSCRHQIYDGTSRRALHPAEIFRQALR